MKIKEFYTDADWNRHVLSICYYDSIISRRTLIDPSVTCFADINTRIERHANLESLYTKMTHFYVCQNGVLAILRRKDFK